MSTQAVLHKIQAQFSGLKARAVRDSILLEEPKDLPKVAQFLRDDPELSLNYLSSVTGADDLDFLESVYHLYSIEKKSEPLVLRVRSTDRLHPKIPSLVSVFRSAEFQEREAYDMYGILYEGHPDLRRLFMWEGFEGWPMRKDYTQEDSEWLEPEDLDWLEKRGVTVSDELKQKAKEPRVIQKPTTDE